MKFIVIFVLLFVLSPKVFSQNLFANPGFEDINICTEYHAPCAPSAWFNVHPAAIPALKGFALPPPMLGFNLLMVPVANIITPDIHPYIYTMLLCPLVKGKTYTLSFYINTNRRKFYHLDFLFSTVEPASKKFDFENISPSLIVTPANLVADMRGGWQYVETEYVAQGGEKFCTIGIMTDQMPYSKKDKVNENGTVYYYLDGIKMKDQNGSTCPEAEHNREILYKQKYRHTEFVPVDEEADKPPKPAKPVFRTDTLTIPNALFETNSAVPKKRFRIVTDSLIALIPQAGLAKIDICGYTDNRGKTGDNQILSEKRAAAVLEYFLQKMPALKESIFATGRGEDFPKADNKTDKGRSINRRVEIVLTYFVRSE